MAVANAQQAAAERSLHDGASDARRSANGCKARRSNTLKPADSADEQLQLLQHKQEQLKVLSPIAGDVITWQVAEKLLLRPVEKGQLLMTVADPKKDWELEIHMPEDRMGAVARAPTTLRCQAEAKQERLPVSYIVATDPGTRHKGWVKEYRQGAEVLGDEGNVVTAASGDRKRRARSDRTSGPARP